MDRKITIDLYDLLRVKFGDSVRLITEVNFYGISVFVRVGAEENVVTIGPVALNDEQRVKENLIRILIEN